MRSRGFDSLQRHGDGRFRWLRVCGSCARPPGVSDPVKGVPDTNISSVQAYIKTELRRAGKESGTLGKLSEILKRHKVFTEEDAKSVSRTMIDTAKLGITASKDYLERVQLDKKK